jgi:hypothetical protein
LNGRDSGFDSGHLDVNVGCRGYGPGFKWGSGLQARLATSPEYLIALCHQPDFKRHQRRTMMLATGPQTPRIARFKTSKPEPTVGTQHGPLVS